MTGLDIAARIQAICEGCKLEAYWDPNGKVWTIGFGHTKGVQKGDEITYDRAVQLLAEDNAEILPLVAHIKSPFEQGALISFGMNCGGDDVVRVLNGTITVTPEGFFKGGVPFGRVSGGKILPGLVNRRKLEAALIVTARQQSV